MQVDVRDTGLFRGFVGEGVVEGVKAVVGLGMKNSSLVIRRLTHCRNGFGLFSCICAALDVTIGYFEGRGPRAEGQASTVSSGLIRKTPKLC